MPVYTIQTPEGRKLKIEASDEATALRGAQEWSTKQAKTPAQKDAERSIDRVGQGGRKPGQAGYSPTNPGKSLAAMEGNTFGFGDEILGARDAIKTGVKNAFGAGPGYSAGEAYKATAEAARSRAEQYRQSNPAGYYANSIGAAIVNPANAVGGEFIGGGANAFAQTGRAAIVGGAAGAASGAGTGTDIRSRAAGAAKGGAIGAALGGALQAGGSALGASARRARAAAPSPQRQLAAQGVQLTPGQMAGGVAQRIEDSMTSVPFVGDSIKNAQRRGIESFDRAALNQVLAPIGQELPRDIDVGRDAVRAAHEAVSNAYNTALDGVTVQADAQIGQEIQRIGQQQILGAANDELQTAVQRVQQALNGPLTGAELKALDEELGIGIRSAPRGPTGRALRAGLSELQDSLDGLLGRFHPDALAGKTAADEAFASLVRVEDAAGRVGAKGGVFSPAQLNSAVRAGDGGRKAAFAQGDALMQGLTDPAVQVLPSTVPDSGTPLRSLMIMLGGGGGAHALGQGNNAIDGVLISAGALSAAGGAIYSRPAITAINAVYNATGPGELRAALGQLSQLAAREPALIPVYQDLAGQLAGQPDAQPPATQ